MKRNFTTEGFLRSLLRGVLALAGAGGIFLAIVVAVGLWETWRWQRGDYAQPIASDTTAFYSEEEELAQLSEVHDLLTARLIEPQEEETQEEAQEETQEEATKEKEARKENELTETANFLSPFKQQAWWHEAQEVSKALATGPRVVIVLDDLGFRESQWRTILAIPSPLTLSFLPSAPNLVEWAQTARIHGHEILLHLPMEPKGDQDPGPNALRVADNRDTLQANLTTLLADATNIGAVGANNHMGSRATEDSALMGEVLTSLRGRGLLFLDSRTTATSVASAEALRLRTAFAERDIFLDHELREDSVRAQLLALEWLARRRGYAIAIGHPHPLTLAVLAEWVPSLAQRGLVLAPLSAVVAEAGGYLPRASGLR